LFTIENAITAAPLQRNIVSLNGTILALEKWFDKQQQGEITMELRTDSQDAWIFQPPLHRDVIAMSNFALDDERCDMQLARILRNANYTVLGSALSIHAIGVQYVPKLSVGAVHHMDWKTENILLEKQRSDVLFSSRFAFQRPV
jgi:hypothetical protein